MSATCFDADFASEFLEARHGGDASGLTRLAGGEWSSAYAYRCQGSERVIRFSRYGDDFAKDDRAGRYASQHLPIPVVVERGEVRGGWYAITPRVRARFLEELDGSAITRALPSVFGGIEAMKLADTSAFTGFGPWDGSGRGTYPSWQSYLLDVGADDPGRRTYGWATALASDAQAQEVFHTGMTALRAVSQACPDDRALVHADLLNRNVFVDADRIVGMIDWGGSLYGDCLYDAALMTFWAPWYPVIDEDAVIGAARELPGARTNFDERMRAYQLHIGLDHITYNAFLGTGRRDELERVCLRTAEIASCT